ncbi:MAG TPA: periplasmic heavy metal sensor [Polyangiaceae bacterium]|nr:periplasmic heavy metal sensor [Polyangiaceae bacterium]
MRQAKWFGFLVFVCLLALSAPSFAQNGAQAKRAEIEARLKKWRGTILRKDVGLDEKKATDIERTLDKFQVEREKVQKDMRQQQKTLRALFDLDSNDQGAYGKSLQIVRESTAKLQSLRLAEFDELAKQLSPKQEAKLLRLMRQMDQKLREAVRRFRKERDDDSE